MIIALAIMVAASAAFAALLTNVLLHGLIAKCAFVAVVLAFLALMILVENRSRWIMATLALESLALAGFWTYLLSAWPWTGAHATATRHQLSLYIAALAVVSLLGFIGLGWKALKRDQKSEGQSPS